MPGRDADFSRERTAAGRIVANVSDRGYGAIVFPVKSDWIEVGMHGC